MAGALYVLIVDDSLVASSRVRWMLEEIDDVMVVGQAGGVSEAMMFLKVWLPHMIVLDLSMPDGSGLEVLRHIKDWNRSTVVAVLTNSFEEHVRRLCEEAGADYFLDKSRDYERLPDIVMEVKNRIPVWTGRPAGQMTPPQ